jgi:hypothetical protein
MSGANRFKREEETSSWTGEDIRKIKRDDVKGTEEK